MLRARARPAPTSRTPRSSTPRTPASSSRSASRPARSPTRSSSGAQHEPMITPSAVPAKRSRQGRRHAPPEGDDRAALRPARARRRRPARSRLHLRARQPDRAAAVLRPAAGAPRDQRAAVGHAQKSGEYIAGGREARPLRGRLHLREVRHRHDEVGQHRADRPAAARARPAAPLLHRLLHLHEVVRAAARGIQLPDRDAARALSGRRPDHADHARLRRQAAEGRGHPGARAGLGRQVRR